MAAEMATDNHTVLRSDLLSLEEDAVASIKVRETIERALVLKLKPTVIYRKTHIKVIPLTLAL